MKKQISIKQINEELDYKIKMIKKSNNLKSNLELIQFLIDIYEKDKSDLILMELEKQSKLIKKEKTLLDLLVLFAEVNLVDNMPIGLTITSKEDRKNNEYYKVIYNEFYGNNEKDKFND